MDKLNNLLERHSMRNQLIMDHLKSTHRLLAREIIQLLEHGLKERITLLCPLPAVDQAGITVCRSIVDASNARVILYSSGRSMNPHQQERPWHWVCSSLISTI